VRDSQTEVRKVEISSSLAGLKRRKSAFEKDGCGILLLRIGRGVRAVWLSWVKEEDREVVLETQSSIDAIEFGRRLEGLRGEIAVESIIPATFRRLGPSRSRSARTVER